MGALFSKTKNDSNDFEKILSELDTCVVYLFKKINSLSTTAEEYTKALVPVIMLPVGIYYIRKGMIHFYEVKQKKEETNLSLLCKEQKEKVEELKKKTSYYTTQSLIERYDEKAAKKKEEDNLRQRKPVSVPTNNSQLPPRSPIPQSVPQHIPQQPMVPQQSRIQQQNKIQQQTMIPQQRSEPQWYDKLVDALVGDAGPETKYALICTHCFAHNGLVLKEEHETIQYTCPLCKQFNPSRKSKKELSKAILEEKAKNELK